jgi:hypothetical protein
MDSIELHWQSLDEDDDRGWGQLRCLYAYIGPRQSELLYLGKAWGKTVFERWCREAKAHFWKDLERERHIFRHRILVGTFALEDGVRLTHRLVQDIESLLIFRTQPWGNIQNSLSCSLSRPDLTVSCRGDWPLKTRRFGA